MKITNIFPIVPLLVFASCGSYEQQHKLELEEFCIMFKKPIMSTKDVYNFFPKTVQDIQQYAAHGITCARNDLDAIITLEQQNRTFDNTVRAVDNTHEHFAQVCNAIEILEMVHPDAKIREACHKEIIGLRTFAVDAFLNKKVYAALKAYIDGNAKKETLNNEQHYFLTETERDFKQAGLTLPDDQFAHVQQLQKELGELTLAFDTNINTDTSTMTVSRDDLAGCDEHFIQSLERDAQGKYILNCSTPIFMEIREQCSVAQTRKDHYLLYHNRAPQNVALLEKIIAKRDELAKTIGYPSYAALSFDSLMAKTVNNVDTFINELTKNVSKKVLLEIKEFAKDLPDGVSLDAQGRFNPWDFPYVKACYKKKYYDVDDRLIAEYFPVDQTLKGVFDIYQRFLSLDFSIIKPSWAWHDDIMLIEVRDKGSTAIRGYIFLDLYPREKKYSHACHAGIVSSLRRTSNDGTIAFQPSVAVMIANFPRASNGRPALFKHSDVETFFHEFGHAMHAVLGATEMAGFSGISVKRDFVEMPSQIFEEWMFDKTLLKGLSHHYKTGNQLPDVMIDKLIALKKFDSGTFVARQCWLAKISLELYKEGAVKNSDAIVQALAESMNPYIRFEKETHMQASFGHLTNYGAGYYSYMWAKVFALDVFYAVKEEGLVNPEAGKVFIHKILSRGGSVDPNELLKDYLGRAPNQEAFFKDLGITLQ